MYEEPVSLLKQEVREPVIYNAIITAIATGASRMSEIATKEGESTTTCTAYIKNLINLGIIKRETPYGEKTSKKTIYSIEDNMFYFWYRFVLENMPIEFISLGRWWGNDPRKRSQTEIDIMGEQDSNSAIFAECKWKNDIVLIMGEFIYANMKKQRVIK